MLNRKKDFVKDVLVSIPDAIAFPFVIVAGLSAATAHASTIVIAGVITIIAGAITMALGAYFTTKTEREHFNADIKTKDQKEREFLSGLGINEEIQNIASGEIIKETERWSDLLSQGADKSPARKKGAAIALAYFAGGLLPIIPFFIYHNIKNALQLCIVISFSGLFISGYIRSRITGANPLESTFRILLFTAIAAGCTFVVAKIIKG